MCESGLALDPRSYDLQPVTDMVFREGGREEWGVVLIVEEADLRYWVTDRLEVDCQAGRHRGTAYYTYRVSLRVTS